MLETNKGDHVAKADKTLEVERSNSHGKLKFRPQNPLAQKFCDLLGQKSLTLKNLEDIKSLGYSITTKLEIL